MRKRFAVSPNGKSYDEQPVIIYNRFQMDAHQVEILMAIVKCQPLPTASAERTRWHAGRMVHHLAKWKDKSIANNENESSSSNYALNK